MRALNTLVAGSGLAQAHNGAPAAAAFVALGLGVPEAALALAVAAVVVATWNLFERSQVGWAQEC